MLNSAADWPSRERFEEHWAISLSNYNVLYIIAGIRELLLYSIPSAAMSDCVKGLSDSRGLVPMGHLN